MMPDQQRSVVVSACILTGLVLAIFGAITAIIGLGNGSTTNEFSGFHLKITTTSIGLIILVVGAGLAVTVSLAAMKRGVKLFGIVPSVKKTNDPVIVWALVVGTAVAIVGLALLVTYEVR